MKRFVDLGLVLGLLVLALAPLPASAGTPPVVEDGANPPVSQEEQWFIYEVNRARWDPYGYAAEHEFTVPSGTPSQLPPLAVNDALSVSSQVKADRMRTVGYADHLCGSTYCANRLAASAGYPLPLWWELNTNYIEAIWGSNEVAYPSPSTFLASPNHQSLFLKPARTDIGVGLATDTDSYFATHIAERDASLVRPFATGVVFDDANGNGRMDVGEGVSGVTVSAGTGLSTTTNGGGGWSLPVGAGGYAVTASGAGFSTTVATFTVGSSNVGVDFRKMGGGTEAIVRAPDAPPGPCPNGKTCDTVVFVSQYGEWFRHSTLEAGDPVSSFVFGNPGDIPFMGDWNCNGTKTPGLYRQSDGFVYLRNTNTQGNADITFFFGNPGDIPIVGDFNKNDCDTVSIYRPSQGRFFIINQLGQNNGGLGAADYDFMFGNPYDQPFVGDFDGDGQDTIGLYRVSTGFAYFRNSLDTGNAHFAFFYGNPGDIILAADWDGDGDDTVAVYRPSNGRLYVNLNNGPGAANYTLFVGYYSGAAGA